MMGLYAYIHKGDKVIRMYFDEAIRWMEEQERKNKGVDKNDKNNEKKETARNDK